MKTYLDAVGKIFKTLGKEQPESIKNFRKFNQAVKNEGVLSNKTKELIGIALSIAHQCKFCVALHVSNALKAGATREEILEASMVAVTLGGGPSLMFMNYVLKALEDL